MPIVCLKHLSIKFIFDESDENSFVVICISSVHFQFYAYVGGVVHRAEWLPNRSSTLRNCAAEELGAGDVCLSPNVEMHSATSVAVQLAAQVIFLVVVLAGECYVFLNFFILTLCFVFSGS